MKPLAPNTLIQNRYLVVQLIGKGGMGEVYLAVDQRLGSAVALKRTYFADDEMLGGAFEREARILARLRHPVLPKVSDHFSENGEQYLVMEHISGDDLSKRLEAAQNSFPSSWVLFWADQLLDALSYLHSHEPPIIHRDIKPQNLKLTDENHIVLLDFGLSKSSTGQTNVPSSKSSGSVVGYTPHYAPMEQIRGTGTGPRSDLYSLSATLFQLMTNSVPVDALSRADAMLNGMPDPIRNINDLNPEISPAVSDVILHGMEVSQERRFGTAREMQKALRKAYSAMHEAMSAHTMVYNGPDGTQGGISGSGGAVSIPSGDEIPASEAMTRTPATGSSGGSSGAVSAGTAGSSPNFDATVKYEGAIDSQLRQADVKTEVYRADDSPMVSSGLETSIPSTPYDNNSAPPIEDFRPTENIVSGEGFSPDATIPIISLESSEGIARPESEVSAAEFFTTPNIPNQTDSYATVTSPRSGREETGASTAYVPNEQSRPVAVPAAKKKSKLPLALGALVVLFILGLAGAGGGWYVYNKYYAAPAPTPEPTLEASPSPEPTAENVFNANSSVNSNSETSSNSNDLTVNPTPLPTATPAITETPGQSRPTPQVQVKETPTRPARTPVSKPPPTPRPRPSIIQ
jgi:serine/threonine protein kinase